FTVAGRESVKRIAAVPVATFGAVSPESVVSYRNVRSIVDVWPVSSVAVTFQCHVPSTVSAGAVNVYVLGTCCTAFSSTSLVPSGATSFAVTVDGRTILYDSGSVVGPGSPFTTGTGSAEA